MQGVDRIYALLDQYVEDVEASGLSSSSKRTYILFAEQFVRWVNRDFEPGARAKEPNEQRLDG